MPANLDSSDVDVNVLGFFFGCGLWPAVPLW
jgi:hypothetical protein